MLLVFFGMRWKYVSWGCAKCICLFFIERRKNILNNYIFLLLIWLNWIHKKVITSFPFVLCATCRDLHWGELMRFVSCWLLKNNRWIDISTKAIVSRLFLRCMEHSAFWCSCRYASQFVLFNPTNIFSSAFIF